MSPESPSINQLWADIIIEELIRHEINYFILSPGSRSTPLTLAVARHKKGTSSVHFDERGAAFHAVGYARATRQAAVLICTSGTAVANYFPAVTEASNGSLPMIILSADRPEELIDTGANQTIDQRNIYGSFARWSVDLSCPTTEIEPSYILNTIDKAVSSANYVNPGPVHLNCRFREPLAPPDEKHDFSGWTKPIQNWMGADAPFTPPDKDAVAADPQAIQKIAEILNSNSPGLLIVGQLASDDEARAVSRLAQKLGWPTFADILSGLRLGLDHDNPEIIPYFDLLLNSASLGEFTKFKTVLHVGGRVTSKRLSQFLTQRKINSYIHVSPYENRLDPDRLVTTRIQSGLVSFSQSLGKLLTGERYESATRLQALSNRVNEVIENTLTNESELSEPLAARAISQNIRSGTALFLASSLPIRLMDAFADQGGANVPVDSNRGVSGIDGTVAAAAGFAVGHNCPVTLLIGDLAMLHDLNSLAILKTIAQPVTVVIINNGGGGIFSLLPISQQERYFERFFAASHELTFEKAAAMFELNHSTADNVGDFVRCYHDAQESGKTNLIEIKTNRAQTAKLLGEINQKINKTIND